MSKARSTERDPDEVGARIEIVGIVEAVSDPQKVGARGSQKFTAVIDITKNPQYPEQLEVEYFGKDLPAWYHDLRHAEGATWRFRGKAASREHKDKFYTRVSIFWAGALSRQPERKVPPAFPTPIPPGESPRTTYDDDQVPF